MLRAHAGSAWRLDSCELEALIARTEDEIGKVAAALVVSLAAALAVGRVAAALASACTRLPRCVDAHPERQRKTRRVGRHHLVRHAVRPKQHEGAAPRLHRKPGLGEGELPPSLVVISWHSSSGSIS